MQNENQLSHSTEPELSDIFQSSVDHLTHFCDPALCSTKSYPSNLLLISWNQDLLRS